MCQHLLPYPSPWGLLSPQLWPGPRRPPPGPRAAQPQPDCGDLPASQHSGLSHEDGTSEQPPGVFWAGPSTSVTHIPTPGEEPGREVWGLASVGKVLCLWSHALGHRCTREA